MIRVLILHAVMYLNRNESNQVIRKIMKISSFRDDKLLLQKQMLREIDCKNTLHDNAIYTSIINNLHTLPSNTIEFSSVKYSFTLKIEKYLIS